MGDMGKDGSGKRFSILLVLVVLLFVLAAGFYLGMKFDQRFPAGQPATANVEINKTNEKATTDKSPTSTIKSLSNSMDSNGEVNDGRATADSSAKDMVGKGGETDLFKDLAPFTGSRSARTTVSGVEYQPVYLLSYGSELLRWNLDGRYSELRLLAGVPDDSYTSSAKFYVLVNNELFGEYEVTKDKGVEEFSVDVSGGKILTLGGKEGRTAILKATLE